MYIVFCIIVLHLNYKNNQTPYIHVYSITMTVLHLNHKCTTHGMNYIQLRTY